MTEYLNVSLSNNASINNDILTVCKEVTEHYKTLVPNGPPLGKKPLHIIHNPSTPIASINDLPQHYTIGLTANERFYAQIAFQFAHELTHIYCDPRITNWFIESICEMASLYFLEYLSNKWATNPPYESWKDYSTEFERYRLNRINEVKTNLAIIDDASLPEKFVSILATINEPYQRDNNTVIALRLNDVFKNNNNFWSLLPFVGQATDKNLTDKCFFENSIPDFDKLISYSNDKEVATRIKKLMKNED